MSAREPGEFDSLEEKLEYLEENGVVFRAGYRGNGEVFTAVMPDGLFIDFHWMEGETTQWFKPTNIERAVDEVIEWASKEGFYYKQDE